MTRTIPVSFEFYPPKTDEQREQLHKTAARLKLHAPEYVSVTFGAGGSTLSYTPETVRWLRDAHALDVAPHISCVGGTRAEIHALLETYADIGVRRLVALRGDLPSGMARAGEFRYASELVRYVRESFGDRFHIEVACYPEIHPQADDALIDLRHFKAKLDAGADGAITQYFYNPDAYFRFVEDARRVGVTAPITAGVMPIANFTQLRRFSEACGAEIPRWVGKRMQAYGDDASAVRALATDLVAGLCRRLIDGGAPALHFYTLNLSKPTLAVLGQLR
ncbi:MAG: methylenetetrahydrofolate reductase [NAD(P)H] [Lysobacteraceae bacterium]